MGTKSATSADGRTREREMHNTKKGDEERAKLGGARKRDAEEVDDVMRVNAPGGAAAHEKVGDVISE